MHGAANYRVTAFVGFASFGWTPDKAFEPMRTVWEPEEVWTRFISEMIERHRR